MKVRIFLTLLLVFTISHAVSIGNGVGYTDQIVIGSKKYFVGININVAAYPAGTAYNIPDPSDTVNTHAVIQKAVTDIGNAGGGTLKILKGNYTLIKNVEFFKSKIHFAGEGIDQTVLKLADYAPSFITGSSKKSGFIRTRAQSNIVVSNMTLDGNKANQYYDDNSIYGRYGLFTEGCPNVWFDAVKIVNFQGYGFDPHGWKSNGIWGKNLTITNCIAENNMLDGFTLDQTYNMTVVNCTAFNNGRHGFNIVTGARFVNITNCTSNFNGFYDPHGGSGCGFMIQNNQLFGTGNVTLTDSTATNSKKAGLCLNNVFNITVNNIKVENTCTCANIVAGQTTQISNTICTTKKLTSLTTTTLSTNAPPATPDPNTVYMWNTIWTKLTTCPV
jgi:parallel beta-helix repeat protein